MDKVIVENLEIETIIGIYEHERNTPQKVVLDLELFRSIAEAAKSENIDDALNYHALTNELKTLVGESKCLLIETLAEKITHYILENYELAYVKLTLRKPDALEGSTNVGVVIERRPVPEKPRLGFMA